jgi:hypothetical protein
VGFLFCVGGRFYGTAFWPEYFWQIFAKKAPAETAVERTVREEKMDVRGTSHDYFNETARHASGDR